MHTDTVRKYAAKVATSGADCIAHVEYAMNEFHRIFVSIHQQQLGERQFCGLPYGSKRYCLRFAHGCR